MQWLTQTPFMQEIPGLIPGEGNYLQAQGGMSNLFAWRYGPCGAMTKCAACVEFYQY